MTFYGVAFIERRLSLLILFIIFFAFGINKMPYKFTENLIKNILKMRNHLAEDVLNIDMLHAMKTYKTTLCEKGQTKNREK
jgi:hypothetical protein